MDDMRFSLVPSDDKRQGTWMIVREIIRDYDARVVRDRDWPVRYYNVRSFAEKQLDELNEPLINV